MHKVKGRHRLRLPVVHTSFTHWCQHKHAPLVPRLGDHMSDITNARRSDATLATFHAGIEKRCWGTV